ncbi:MAG TPA: hypothetical protein PL009_00270 [Flavipsychrobacter sp.]|nr:hypothetical protein [Flavipsychrobacter sp.]
MKDISSYRFPELNLPAIVFWLSLSILFPVLGGNILFGQVLKTIAFFFAALGIGLLILSPAKMIRDLPPVLLNGLSWLIGGSIIFLLLGLLKSSIVVYIIAALTLTFFLVSYRWNIRFDKFGFAAVLPCLLFLFHKQELRLALSESFIDMGGDYFYFEAIVVSLSKTLTIFDTIFHTGAALNYSSLPFFAPAALSNFTGVNGHIAYSGMYVPMLKILSFAIMAATAVKIAAYIRPDINPSWRMFLAASICLILLAPLHPLYLARLDIKNFIFRGEGYLLPMGNMGFPFAFVLFAVACYYFFDTRKKTVADFLLYVLLVAFIAAAKPAFFLPAVAFLGLLSIYRIIADRSFYPLVVTILGFVGGMAIAKIFTGNDGGMINMKFTWNNGYFLHYLTKNASEFHLPASTLGAVSLFFIMMIIWLGLKVIIFGRAWLYEQETRPYLIISMLTIGAAALPGWFLNIHLLDETGRMLQDASFDTAQFLRGGLFLSTFMATTCLTIELHKFAEKKLFGRIVVAWFVLSATCLVFILNNATPTVATDWEEQIAKEFKLAQPKQMAMLSNSEFRGQVLVANGIGPWWICCERTSNGTGFLNSLTPNYRNIMLKKLLSDSATHEQKQQILSKMTQEGVDVIVATPAYVSQLEKLVQEGLLEYDERYKWLYYLSSRIPY